MGPSSWRWILIILRVLLDVSCTQSSCHGNFLPGGFYFATGRNMVGNHSLSGYVFETLTVSLPVQCFRKCRSNCRCISFNYLTTVNQPDNCELNEENKYLKPDALQPKEGSQYYDLIIDYNVVVGGHPTTCHNGCCQIQPCLNGGTCHETCDVKGKRMQCVCAPGFTGFRCEIVKSCNQLYKYGERDSRVYTIDPDGSSAFDVFCDQTTAGGGWTVFQKRLNGSVDFYRDWANYTRGFGNLTGEFWLGLDKIHRLTNSSKYKLRVDLEDMSGNTAYAEYDLFAVGSEGTKYQLSVGNYTGTAGDSLTNHNGYPFTTKDQDNDSYGDDNCAVRHKGAWWYNNCYHSNLNGVYHHGYYLGTDGIRWRFFSNYSSAKRAEMKIRPVDF